MAEALTIARPYAQAAFDEASKQNRLKEWSDALQAATDALSNPLVRSVMDSPRVDEKRRESVMLALCGGKLAATEQNFIRILVENHRLPVLEEITTLFETMRAEAEKSVDVTVTSAFDLSDAQKQKIAAAMKARTGREVRLHCQLDRDLLGGIVIRAGDKVIDGSARAKLSELAMALA